MTGPAHPALITLSVIFDKPKAVAYAGKDDAGEMRRFMTALRLSISIQIGDSVSVVDAHQRHVVPGVVAHNAAEAAEIIALWAEDIQRQIEILPPNEAIDSFLDLSRATVDAYDLAPRFVANIKTKKVFPYSAV